MFFSIKLRIKKNKSNTVSNYPICKQRAWYPWKLRIPWKTKLLSCTWKKIEFLMLSKLPKSFIVEEGLLLHKESLHNKDCLLADFKPNFKRAGLSYLDELLNLLNIYVKLYMSSFYPQPKLSQNSIDNFRYDLNNTRWSSIIDLQLVNPNI